MKNFLRLDGRSILSVPYMYIDHKDYLADSLLTQNHVSVRFGSEFSRDNSPYRIIICKVRKKDTAEFEKSMESLRNKMLLFGHSDYMEFCNGIMETLEQNRCIFRKNCASVPEERSAIPLQTEQSSAG